MAAVLVACSGAPASTTATGDEMTLSDLSGNWDNGDLYLQVADDGTYQVLEEPGAVERLMGGFVARDGTDFDFVTDTSGECPGQTGVYSARLEGETLALSVVDDPCELRVAGFTAPFQRS